MAAIRRDKIETLPLSGVSRLFPWLKRAIGSAPMRLLQFLSEWAVFVKAGNLSKILLQDNKPNFLFVPYQETQNLLLLLAKIVR